MLRFRGEVGIGMVVAAESAGDLSGGGRWICGGGHMNENAIHGAPKKVKNGELH